MFEIELSLALVIYRKCCFIAQIHLNSYFLEYRSKCV